MAQMPDLTKMINDALNGAREQIAEAVHEMAQPMLDAAVANEAVALLAEQERPEDLGQAYSEVLDRLHEFADQCEPMTISLHLPNRDKAIEALAALVAYVRVLDA